MWWLPVPFQNTYRGIRIFYDSNCVPNCNEVRDCSMHSYLSARRKASVGLIQSESAGVNFKGFIVGQHYSAKVCMSGRESMSVC
jgi:hypothetical protein